jgi:hypothetical protein
MYAVRLEGSGKRSRNLFALLKMNDFHQGSVLMVKMPNALLFAFLELAFARDFSVWPEVKKRSMSDSIT